MALATGALALELSAVVFLVFYTGISNRSKQYVLARIGDVVMATIHLKHRYINTYDRHNQERLKHTIKYLLCVY